MLHRTLVFLGMRLALAGIPGAAFREAPAQEAVSDISSDERVVFFPTVARLSEQPLDSELGHFNLITYRDSVADQVHLALTVGDINPEEPTLVRVHNMDPLRDLLQVNQPGRWSLRAAMAKVAEAGSGVVLLLGHQTAGDDLLVQVRDGSAAKAPTTYSTVGTGSQILRDLVSRSSLITLMYQPLGAAAHSQEEHVELVKAIAARDEERAAQLMEQHLLHVEGGLAFDRPVPTHDIAQALA